MVLRAETHPHSTKWELFARISTLRWQRHQLLCELPESSQPLPKRSFDGGQVLGLLCKEVGLAEAYQWVHLRELR